MREARRVVVDSNTIVSGILIPESVPGRLLRHLAGNVAMVFSAATRDELLEVIAREKFDRYVAFDLRERAVTAPLSDAEMVVPRRRFSVCRDAKDDKFLDVAYAARAGCIVSGDADLRVLGMFEGIPIIGAAQYMARFAQRL